MSEIPKCRILLDVDGVLNAVTRFPDSDQWTDWCTKKCMGYNITYSPTVGQRLLALAQRPGVELIWLTTWEHNANRWIGPLFGWPTFPVLDRHDIHEGTSGLLVADQTWWKYVEARALYEADEVPFVWVDDDLVWNWDGAVDWVKSLNDAALAISPGTSYGLTPTLVDEVEKFVVEKTTD